MIPIQELLARILWDKDFGEGSFAIGYYDRVEDRIIRVSFSDIIIEKGNHFSFTIVDVEGVVQTIPLHRIREVYKNNQLIWQRDQQ